MEQKNEQSALILVVDDEPDIRHIIRILLESGGYRVAEAQNGLAAVEYVRKQPGVDLVLMDIMMPGLDGVSASREIRECCAAPILFLTAKTQEQDKLEAEKERIRAQRRAENPDGITENTSKKRLQKQQRDQEAAAKAEAAREYAAKKGKLPQEKEEKETLSGIADRPYCKGRAYDPNRYAHHSQED